MKQGLVSGADRAPPMSFVSMRRLAVRCFFLGVLFTLSFSSAYAQAPLTGTYTVDPTIRTEVNRSITFALTREAGERFRDYLREWWQNEYLPSLKDMTAQLHASVIDQTRQIGSMQDSQGQTVTAREIQALEHDQRRNVVPHEQSCVLGSNSPALATTLKTSFAIQKGLKNDLTATAQGAPGTPGEFGQGAILKERFEEYCEMFHDPANNNNVNACPAPTVAGAIPDGDIDIENMLLRDTIDFDKPPERAAAQALMINLLQPKSYGRLHEDVIDTNAGREWTIRKERIESIRKVASDVVSAIIARRASIILPDSVSQGSPVPPPAALPPPSGSTPSAPIPSAGTYDDFIIALAGKESGGPVGPCSYGSIVGYTGPPGNNYLCVNSIGFIGRYQMGYAALIDVGCVKAGVSRNSQLSNPLNWTGTCGSSATEFLNSPAAQDAAIRRYMQIQWGYISSVQSAACTTVGGIPLTASGMLAAAHLVGWTAVVAFVNSGGTDDRCDAYGTCASDYLTAFAGYDTPFMDNACNPGDFVGGGDTFTPYTPPDPRPVKDIVREIRLRAGIDPSEIAENPSYNEIMLALTKEHFFDPKYFTDVADNIGAMKHQETALNAYISMTMQDIYTLQEQINLLVAARAGLLLEQEPLPARVENKQLR